MQLVKIIAMITVLLPSFANANNCTSVVKLESAYLQNKTIYLDEILSQPIINNQLCLNSNDMVNNTEPYYLELFSDHGLSLDSLLIFPEYFQRAVVTITTADLLTHFCRQCNDLAHYRRFVNSTTVKGIAAEMDAIIAKDPNAIMLDVIKQQFQPALLNLYKLEINPPLAPSSVASKDELNRVNEPNTVASEKIMLVGEQPWLRQLKNKVGQVQLPDHYLPIYRGAKLQNFVPEGLHLNRIASLPLASYSVDASAASVLNFYQSLYPDYERIKFGHFVVLVQGKPSFEGYSPEYMAIPHIVISAGPLGKDKTILQIIYRPDADGINGMRAIVLKPVT
jgi:hypothetical protein